MKFSIITPLYNGLPHLPKCVGSIKAQASDKVCIEHLVQDGLSNDGSVNFLNKYYDQCLKNKNYYFDFQSKKDDGMYDAINCGWNRASGDILCWLNHDEQYLPGTIEHIADMFNKYPDVDVIYGDMIVVDPSGNSLAARREIPLREFYVKHDFLYAISCTIFFRRALFDEGLMEFNPKLKNAGDLDLILGILKEKKKFFHTKKYLSLFGVDGENLSVALKDNMNKEMKEIQIKHGAIDNFFVRKLVKILRIIERLFNGCYKLDDLSYLYAINEKPIYEKKTYRNIGSRFTYEIVEKKMKEKNV